MKRGQGERSSGRGKRAEPTGLRAWVSAALGGVVLVLGGFLLGVGLGIVSEEPDIVASHLLGGSDEVVWDAAPPGAVSAQAVAPAEPAQTAELAEMAESSGTAELERTHAAASPSVQRSAVRTPPVSAPPKQLPQGWAIQVGAFSSSGTADSLAESLSAKGFQTYLKPSAGPADGRWRVRVGPLTTRSEAESIARRLERDESLSTWVVSEGGS